MPWLNALIMLIIGVVLVAINGLLPYPLSAICYIVGIIVAIIGLILLIVGLVRGSGWSTRV
jgi:membrane-bound ClpP family serine protease